MESNMLNKLLGAAAMAAAALVVVPAHAAKMGAVGCSGDNQMKAESKVDSLPDGDGKIMAQKEMAMAQEALLSGKMGACGMHLSKAMQAGLAK
jgi:hypothetical protein